MADKTGTGLKKETAAALAYVLGPLTGFVMLILEKDEFVRFHSIQSILVFGGLFVVQWLLGITVVLSVLIPLTTLAAFVLWLVLIYKALQGERFEIPVVTQYVNKLLK